MTHLDAADIVRETPTVRRALRLLGVDPVDLDDEVQKVVIGAWRSMEAGRFRVVPGRDVRHALRCWLFGVSWRCASHYRAAAARRVIPGGLQIEIVGPDPDRRFDARADLRVLASMPLGSWMVLMLSGLGYGVKELAPLLGIGRGAVAPRLYKARRMAIKMVHGPRLG